MKYQLRIARASNDLKRISKMYLDGLGLEILGSFLDHAGFDGVMIGASGVDYHFEFTHKHGELAPDSNSPEQLLVFYTCDIEHSNMLKTQMVNAGFELVKSHNPYWDLHGYTFKDFEGYRVVLCHDRFP